MDEIFPCLFATKPMSPGFAPSSSVRAWLVRREAGNVLLYATTTVSTADEDVRRLGGIADVYLSHWHEAGFGAAGIGAPVHVHEADLARTRKEVPDALPFTTPHRLDERIELIPMPGHTSGSTAFRVTADDGTRLLFTGDTLWFGPEDWKVAILPESDRATYLETLRAMRTLDFDVLVPSFAAKDGPFYERLTADVWQEKLDAVIARVEAGERF